MRIEYIQNGMYRASYQGMTAIAPSRYRAVQALLLHIGSQPCL